MKTLGSLAAVGMLVLGGCAQSPEAEPAGAHPMNDSAATADGGSGAMTHDQMMRQHMSHHSGSTTQPGGMRMMRHENAGPSTAPTTQPTQMMYVCPMHPDVTANQPGTCPKCGMKLQNRGAR